MMTPDDIRLAGLALQVLNALASAGLWVYVKYGDRNNAVDRKFAELEASMDKRIDDLEKGQAAIRSSLVHAPTHGDLARIHTRIDEVAKGISHIQGEFTGTSKTVDLIHQYLMSNGVKQ